MEHHIRENTLRYEARRVERNKRHRLEPVEPVTTTESITEAITESKTDTQIIIRKVRTEARKPFVKQSKNGTHMSDQGG
jgi:hypothetical protein